MSETLRQVLATLGDPLVSLLTAPAGLAVEVRDVVIHDVSDPPDAHRGDLVLIIGGRGRAAEAAVRAAAQAGAAAVAVKSGTELVEQAQAAGVALLQVGEGARWEQVEALVRGIIDLARSAGEAADGEVIGDLFSLAQTTATLTGGLVTIEDTANRVLAYSRTGDEVDELRRLSILGRQGPESYLAMLRDWGVYQRLRAGEGVVRIEEHPELGIRRRIAAGIHAGSQPLGTVWVQEGATPLTNRAETALLGASRTLAPQLLRHRARATPDVALRQDMLINLLEGQLDAQWLAEEIDADPETPVLVVVFGVQAATGNPPRPLVQAELVNVISVHAAAYRRSAMVAGLGGRVYAVLPDLPNDPERRIVALATEIVEAAAAHLALPVYAALGAVSPRLAETAASRADADRVLDAMLRGHWAGPVASLSDVRARVLVSEVVGYLAEHPRLRDPRLAELSGHDARHGSDLGPSVLAYLDAFGDVRRAASALNVHPNPLRYRLRRAQELVGIDLGDPEQRLLAALQLRL
jgi:DNA-binding PucR family transcriptional regulator